MRITPVKSGPGRIRSDESGWVGLRVPILVEIDPRLLTIGTRARTCRVGPSCPSTYSQKAAKPKNLPLSPSAVWGQKRWCRKSRRTHTGATERKRTQGCPSTLGESQNGQQP